MKNINLVYNRLISTNDLSQIDVSLFKSVVDYGLDNFITEFPDFCNKIDYLISGKHFGFYNKNVCEIVDKIMDKRVDFIHSSFGNEFTLDTYHDYEYLFEFILNNNHYEKVKKYKLFSGYLTLTIITKPEYNDKDIYFDIIVNFVNNYCNNEKELISFVKLLEKCYFFYYFGRILNNKTFNKFAKEILKYDIPILEIFQKMLIENINNKISNNYCLIILLNILDNFTNTKKSFTKKSYEKIMELIIKDLDNNDNEKIYKLIFIKYLLINNIYLEKSNILNFLKKQSKYECFCNPNYKLKDRDDYDYEEDLDENNFNKVIKKQNQLVDYVFDKYLDKNIMKIDNDLIIYLLENNCISNCEKVYDNILLNFIKKNPELISKKIIDKAIEVKNFYVIIEIINNKYILDNKQVDLILEQSLCLDELFDIIFNNYLEKNRDNFEKWLKYHSYNLDYIPKFDLNIDDSYIDVFYECFDNLTSQKNKLQEYTKINIKKIDFYDSFLKKTNRYYLDEKKINDILKKYKKINCKIDSVCIENLLKANYDQLACDLMSKHCIEMSAEKMVLFSNDFHTRKKYLEIMKKNLKPK